VNNAEQYCISSLEVCIVSKPFEELAGEITAAWVQAVCQDDASSVGSKMRSLTKEAVCDFYSAIYRTIVTEVTGVPPHSGSGDPLPVFVSDK
jgi:hypothetical protein